MTRRLSFESTAREDLRRLYDWIAAAGGEARAHGYLQRIRRRCESLVHVPLQGTRRDDLGAGVRTVAYGRRGIVAFVVSDDAVTILRVLHGGRDLTSAFGAED